MSTNRLTLGGWRPLAVVGLLATLFVVAPPTTAATSQVASPDNPTLVVNSTGDEADASGADGVCATAAGTCTLRAAISQANYNRGADRIEFAIGGPGVQTIAVGSPLPTLNDPTGGVTIDGYTQPGAVPNTLASGSNAVIRIEVRGRGANTTFLVESAENTIRGLAVFGADFPIELRGEGADGNLIVGNFIGTNATATSLGTVDTGVTLNLGPDRNRIGTPDPADRNVVAGYRDIGIRINHGETSENRIQNNIVGLSPDGTRNMGAAIGIDVQWWTWGNLIGGTGAGEGNVVSGHGVGGIDLSHKATGNLVVGNLVGTTLDGRSANPITRNGNGLVLKDDPVGNYFQGNVVAGASTGYAIWHKHNYTGRNLFVDNRIGVGVGGTNIGSDKAGMLLRGHDDIYDGNIFANIGWPETILISNTTIEDFATFEPPEQTLRNAIRRGTYYNNADVPIEFGSECCPHPNEDTPDIVGIGPGQVNGNATCAGCEVEVYVSGTVRADGSLDPTTGTTGLTWIGTVVANQSGVWSMGSPLVRVGARVAVNAITPAGEVSNFSPVRTVPAQGTGLIPNPNAPTTPQAPAAPPLPPLYQPVVFTCAWVDGVLSWDDAGAPEYYVFAVRTAGGSETYLGGHTTTSLTDTGAVSYRVEHWVRGIATNALCNGPGPVTPVAFTCAWVDGVLSWDDAGAPEYYVFAVRTAGGSETYLGGHTTTSLTDTGAVSYRVEHWVRGIATNAFCQP